MLIAIFICLLSDTRAVEQFRFERLQGQCSAWCYEEYGTWAPAPLSSNRHEDINVFQCLNNGLYNSTNKDCHDCDIGCSREFHNLAECYSWCNEMEPCRRACRKHQELSRLPVDVAALNRNLERAYPSDVYEEVDGRSNTTVVVFWHHMQLFTEKRSVVFLLFLLNYTSADPNEEPQGLYIGSTPYFSFVAEPLSQNYCYGIKILTVAKDRIVGRGVSSKKFITDAIINTDSITSRSADIWFQTRPCADLNVNYKVLLTYDLKGTDGNERDLYYKDLEGPPVLQNNIYRTHAANLLPGQTYKIIVERTTISNPDQELFPYDGEFTTLSDNPGTDVTISQIVDVTPNSITYLFGLTDETKLYDETISYYLIKMKINQTGETIQEIRVDVESEDIGATTKKEITGLIPYTYYCVSIAVANSVGLGPFSENCTRTPSTPAGPPTVRLMSVTTNSSVIQVTRPDPPNGLLVRYYVHFIHNGHKKRNVTITEGPQQNITLQLDSHINYTIKVAAVNSNEERGDEATLHLATPEAVPEAAPQVSSCDILHTNSTHISAKVNWISVEDDKVNGELTYYYLNLLQEKLVDGENVLVKIMPYNFTTKNATQEVYEVFLFDDIILDYSEDEMVSAQLAISTLKGVGPWSKLFLCTIDDPAKMGVDAIQILVIVICIIALFVFVLGGFFYFFRFKSYKKTPYEEIKKLIRADTFSPCQHCQHNKDPKRWDVFICHVSEDTEYIVQLKEAFVREKIDVFFAKDELSWGCELHRVINDGLRDSKYGLVVLSKQFVNKCSKWTSSELSSLHSKSRLSSQDCILPIWKKDITDVDVGAFDMTLVGIKALKEDEMSVDQMAVELKKKLRSSNTCWGCKSYEYQWSASDYSLDNSPVDSLHTTLL